MEHQLGYHSALFLLCLLLHPDMHRWFMFQPFPAIDRRSLLSFSAGYNSYLSAEHQCVFSLSFLLISFSFYLWSSQLFSHLCILNSNNKCNSGKRTLPRSGQLLYVYAELTPTVCWFIFKLNLCRGCFSSWSFLLTGLWYCHSEVELEFEKRLFLIYELRLKGVAFFQGAIFFKTGFTVIQSV